MAIHPTAAPLLSQTAAELSQQCAALKAQALALIGQHFLRYPEPFNRPDHSGVETEYVALLDYPVTTNEESEAYIIELRATGFTFEGPHGTPACEQYEVLPVEELVDLLRVLENRALPVG